MFALLIVACVHYASMRRQSARCVFDRSNELDCAIILRWCLHIVFVLATLPPPPWLIEMCFVLSVRTQVMTIASTRSPGESLSSGVWATSWHPLPSIFDFLVGAEVSQMQNTAIIWYRSLRRNMVVLLACEVVYLMYYWQLTGVATRATTSIHHPSLIDNTNFMFLSHLI
jgi:hypothetical protein